MVNYLIRRLLIGMLTLLVITFIIYGLIRNMPGDPSTFARAEADPSKKIDPKEVERMRKNYGLDKSVPEGYLIWVQNIALRFDFGRSFYHKKPVLSLIGEAVGPTLLLSVPALCFSYLLAVPMGLWSTVRSGRLDERSMSTFLYMIYSLPSYVAALLLLMIFAVWLDETIFELPLGGIVSRQYEEYSFAGKVLDIAWHMALPVFCFTYGSLAYYSRFVKSNMEEVIRQDYIRTARAKGVSRFNVIVRHAFRNTLIPFVTMLGLTLPGLISGSVILEQVFNWPGMGKLFFEALLSRDYPVIMGETLMYSTMTLVGQLVADMLYALVDPRVNYS